MLSHNCHNKPANTLHVLYLVAKDVSTLRKMKIFLFFLSFIFKFNTKNILKGMGLTEIPITREFCQLEKAHLECYLIHWWEECAKQQRKVNCWYCHDGSWTLAEDSCLCLLVKLSVEDNSRERGKETYCIKYIFLIICTYNWTTTVTGQKEHHKLAAKVSCLMQ